jgi:hypothetical protein
VNLSVVRGFADLIAAMDPAVVNSLDFVPVGQGGNAELWIGDNASDGGYGAIVPGGKGETLQIGNLLGLKGEGDRYWSVGVIRRLTRDAESNRYVGIEPTEQKILVNKSSVHFRADFEPIAEKLLICAAPGAMPADTATLPWTRLRPGIRIKPNGPAFAPSAQSRSTSPVTG